MVGPEDALDNSGVVHKTKIAREDPFEMRRQQEFYARLRAHSTEQSTVAQKEEKKG